jgi:hypothetical protein
MALESRKPLRQTTVGRRLGRIGRIGRLGTRGALGAFLVLCAGMSGCGLAAAPCRIASAGLKIVPVVGHVAAAPTDACAGVIDP